MENAPVSKEKERQAAPEEWVRQVDASVRRRRDLPSWPLWTGTSGVDPRLIRREATPAGPVPEPIDGLGRRDGDRNDILSSLNEREIEQRRQTTAGPDLRSRPLLVRRPLLPRIEAELLDVEPPDRVPLALPRQVEEEDPIKPFRPGELGGSREMSLQVATRYTSEVWSFIQVGGSRKAGGNSGVPGPGHTAEGLLDLVDEQDAGGHRIGDAERSPDVLLGLADQGAHQRADVETERRASGLPSEGLGEGTLAGPRNPQQRARPWGFVCSAG